jgi:hypothetical protein
MSIHMGTDDGKTSWCGQSGPATLVYEPTASPWCPHCVAVFEKFFPGKALPPTLQPCTKGAPACSSS